MVNHAKGSNTSTSGDGFHAQNFALENAGLKLDQVAFLGRGAFLVEDFGAPPVGSPQEVVDALTPRAKAGDPEAAYALYLKINECKEIIDSRAMGASSQPIPDAARQLEECIALDPESYATASQWLELAADRGNLSAMLLYSSAPEAMLTDAAEMLKDPQAVVEYKQKAVRHLENAALLGSVDALLRLGNAYRAGIITNQDYQRSYAYYEAVKMIDPSLVPQQTVDDIGRSLNSRELIASRDQGRAIYERCCAN